PRCRRCPGPPTARFWSAGVDGRPRLWVQLSFLCDRCARCGECPGFCFSHLSRRSRGSPDHSPLCPFVSFVVTAFPDLGDDVAISPVSAIPPPGHPKNKGLTH